MRHDDDRIDQDDLRLEREATADLIDGGATLAEVSSRAAGAASKAAAQRKRYLGCLSTAVSGGHVSDALEWLAAWAHEVDASLTEQVGIQQGSCGNSPAQDAAGSSESEHGQPQRVGQAQLGEAPVASTALQRDAVAEAHERAIAEACGKCGTTLQCDGPWRTCAKCNQSWKVPERVRPLAQSAWVPDEPRGAQVFRDKGKPPVQTVSERIRELEAEVERLKAANATLATDARSAYKVTRGLRELLDATHGPDRERVYSWALHLREVVHECEHDRIEFSVKEVLP